MNTFCHTENVKKKIGKIAFSWRSQTYTLQKYFANKNYIHSQVICVLNFRSLDPEIQVSFSV